MKMTDLEPIRKSLETFNEEIEREMYENFSGQKDDIDTDKIYTRYAPIFENEDLVDEVGIEALLGDIGAEDKDVPAARGAPARAADRMGGRLGSRYHPARGRARGIDQVAQ